MLKVMTFISLLVLTGCITVHECDAEHKETYNNISASKQQSSTSSTVI